MTLVFDSGVWISALHFGGTPSRAINAVSKRATIAICDQILEEIHRSLTMKFDWQADEVDRALNRYAPDLSQVGILGLVRGVCRDPKDDMVLDCAVTAGASLIVTGDKDLLALVEYEGIRIVTPRAFLDEFPALPLP